jgi:hypothetical protein
MTTPAEYRCLWGTAMLVVELNAHRIPCVVLCPVDEAPCVRVPGLDTLECVATASDRYEIWSIGGGPPDPAPLRVDQSLAEAVMYLGQIEGRA